MRAGSAWAAASWQRSRTSARAAGATIARLETNRTLVEAIAMYRTRGYDEVPAFNDERYAHHWFEKRLDP